MSNKNHEANLSTAITGVFALTPFVAFATPANFREVLGLGMTFAQAMTGVAWILLLVVFIFNVIKFLLNFEDEHAREEGKKSMVFSLLATAIVVMVWGILTLLSDSFFGGGLFGVPLLTPPA